MVNLTNIEYVRKYYLPIKTNRTNRTNMKIHTKDHIK